MTEEISKFDGADVKRRALIKGAAWSVPVIAVAVAAPAHAASGDVVDNVQVEGHCGGLGVLAQGFSIDSGGSTIPAGSTFTITPSGLLDLGLISWDLSGFGGLLTATILEDDSHVYTFNSDWTGSGSIGSVVTVGVAQGASATLAFPPGTKTGDNNKLSGSFNQLALFLCEDN